jgi:dienelactone hydrolase
VRWIDEQISDGVRVRQFDLRQGPRTVPGLLWSPAEPTASTSTPLVLLGHGASGSKTTDYVVNLARALVRLGMAAAAVDGPVHGDRRPDGGRDPRLVFLEFCQAWSSRPTMTDEMVADLVAVLDSLLELGEFDPAHVAWWGVSMGTIIGLPFVAAEPRVSVAVLGLMGLTGPTKHRIAADAPRVQCPTLFLVQWDDELFGRDDCFELFDAIGAPDKRMHVYPGRHGSVPVEAFRASEAFLACKLG